METEEFEAKKRDIAFRDTKWFEFQGTLYRNKVELGALKNFLIDRPDLVLDVGAGSGRITKEFAKSGAEIIALDYSVESLRTNKANSGAQVIAADMCYLPFRSSVFNEVVALSVLQLIPTPKSRLEALKEVKRVLKPDSRFLVETYNYRPLYDGLIKRKKEGYYRSVPPVYYYRFHYNELYLILVSVFTKIIEFRAILILNPLMQGALGNVNILAKLAAFLEKIIVKTRLSFLFADHLLAICKKS